ncbi:MAG: aldo/keto reductase family protein [Actinomycetota bacterium]
MNAGSAIQLLTGHDMPILGLGTWQLDKDTPGTIEKALALGYRMIDTSGDYGTQPGIKEGVKTSDVDRDDIYVVTKVEEDEDAYESTRRNVSELGLEQADLMLIHRPPTNGPGIELWTGLIRAREEGLTKDIGVSNYSIQQIEALIDDTGDVPAVNQIEWTPFGWSPEMLEYCRRRNIVIQAYSPLTRGDRLDDDGLGKIAAEYGRTPAQILIRWNLQMGIVPLVKANDSGHLEENLGVFDFEISEAHMEELNDLNEHWSSLGSSLQYL